jgi:hypothetical protein
MKKNYLLLFPVLCILAVSCSKDFLKSYDRRIEGGTWELYDVNSFGIGGGYSLPFTSGRFRFFDDGQLEYTDNQGNFYEGSWNIRKEYRNDETLRQLIITAVDFQTQQVLSETFDDMMFTGTNRFKAFIYTGGKTYTFKFKR